MYRPPPFEVADKITAEAIKFLQSCGYPYNEIKPYVVEHILICIATGQFFYKRNEYFICWLMTDSAGIELLKHHQRPSDITSGEIMYIAECGAKAGLQEIIRKLRKKGTNGVHWHRAGKGWQHFHRDRRDDRSGGTTWATTAPAAPAHH